MQRQDLNAYFRIILGSIIYAFSVRMFVSPVLIYDDGFMGTSQFITRLLNQNGFNNDYSAYIYFFLNLPLLLLAIKYLSPKFVIKTILSVVVQSVALALIPTPTAMLISEKLANIIFAGIISGVGIGLILSERTSAGGTALIGMFLARKKICSVGTFAFIYNCCLYLLCAYFFNIETALYSIIYAAIFSFVTDMRHLPNRNVSVMIFTRNAKLKKYIIEDLHRGATYWKGYGAYGDQQIEVLITIISEAELHELKDKIKKIDEHAFVVVAEDAKVYGAYEKRLT